MGVFQLPLIDGNSFNSIQLLSNGKVLMWNLAGACYIYEPNEFGSYRYGSFRRVKDMPLTQWAGPNVTLKNGKLAVFAGEYGFSAGNHVQVFDPESETWDVYFGESIAAHSLALMFDDGAIYGGVRTNDDARKHSMLLPDSKPNEWSTYVITNFNTFDYSSTAASWLSSNFNLSQYGWFGEAVATLLPNGWYLIAECPLDRGTGDRWLTQVGIYLVKPISYNPQLVMWGNADVKPRLNQLTGWWRLPNNERRARWASIGSQLRQTVTVSEGTALDVWYEPGTMVWMPKIQKAVLVDGLGSIITITPPPNSVDPNQIPSMNALVGSITRAATMPFLPLPEPGTPNAVRLSGVSPIDAGKTGEQIASQGTLTMTAEDQVYLQSIIQVWNSREPKRVHVQCANNTKFMTFHFTNAVAVDASQYRFEGVQLPDFSGATWDGTTLQQGDVAVDYCPILCHMDQPVAILPNGDLLAVAGVSFGGFSANSALVKWDGVQPTAEIVDRPGDGRLLIPLPDGVVLGTMWGYECSEAEATPLQSSIPTITNAPSAVTAGERFSLTGTTLTGTHEGAYTSEDWKPATNIPLVRLVGQDGRVWYCQTRDYTYRGIEPGRTSSCNVVVPFDVPAGTYSMQVVVNGVASASRPIAVNPLAGGESLFLNFIP
jgi:hypothetical protein